MDLESLFRYSFRDNVEIHLVDTLWSDGSSLVLAILVWRRRFVSRFNRITFAIFVGWFYPFLLVPQGTVMFRALVGYVNV